MNAVVNDDLPTDLATYIHRVGRCGRYGRRGVALNFVRSNDARQLQNIMSFYSTTILEMPENIADYF